VDGVMSVVTMILVWIYVPESPAWKAENRSGLREKDSKKVQKHDASIPCSAYLFGVSVVFTGLQNGIVGSMLPISLRDKFGWDALHVGYTSVAMALVTLVTGVWLSPRLQACIGHKGTTNLASFICGLGFFAMGFANDPIPFLVAFGAVNVGVGLRQASQGTIKARLTNPKNRGVVFSVVSMFQKVGAVIGPIIGGRVAAVDSKHLLWWTAGVSSLVGAMILFFIKLDQAPDKGTNTLLTAMADTSPGEEIASDEDYNDLGRRVGNLLTCRNHQWVSQKPQVYKMFELLVPTLEEGETLTCYQDEAQMKRRIREQLEIFDDEEEVARNVRV